MFCFPRPQAVMRIEKRRYGICPELQDQYPSSNVSVTPIETGLRSIRVNLKEAGQGCSRSPSLKRSQCPKCIVSITWRAALFN
jgi:hypothetical protein